ncbi:lytic transglycosylase domain-containing protein [Endozoicomonas sp.]|uniref:lytic transglycosylase domain-containing protein n=1 Tax=Endozoicomonas sp. TaxID=1892382 RepID=UPI003AF54F78
MLSSIIIIALKEHQSLFGVLFSHEYNLFRKFLILEHLFWRCLRLTSAFVFPICFLCVHEETFAADTYTTEALKQVETTTTYRPVCIHDPKDGWQPLRHGFRLMAHYHNEKVLEQISAFPQYYFNRLSERILAHQYYLNQKIQEKGLPSELALLPLIESELNLKAKSSAKAIGVWQLMPRTARAYGLNVSKKCDERTDLEKATDAALTYIEYLYRKTNDWILTIAAYNAGLYRVRQSIAKAEASGEYPEEGFWSLGLPAETRKHVAKFLALSHVVLLPGKHGIKLPSLAAMEGEGFSNVKSGYHSPECVIPSVGCLYCRQLVFMAIYVYFQSLQGGGSSLLTFQK